ncbi:hypothetical protein J7438_08510 [Thalassotalea sp. G20_0]|uniref:hypothetical protein n=1 Tax=Thalassotalea sp. G20_0 TaxID=2821093 RepID=UPI001ADAD9D1|nr:hypothetical protein [Thalassotalea sp. G20_0]MBO9494127.1 hypothetical protein [Thalassotalea sp. G20_0]
MSSYYPRRNAGSIVVAAVHGVARLQVVNGVVSRGTADIVRYMMAAAVSDKKLVRGINMLV